jgi:DNA processing protein
MEQKALLSGDAQFPARLRDIAESPPRLFLRGDRLERTIDVLARGCPAIAIVGARDATAYGLSVARTLARGLAEIGVVVVSGLAVGIDGAAHRGALDGGGLTVAVVAGGTDVLYPRHHAALREDILRSGAVVSEHPPGTVPYKAHFPARNRIISGLCLGVIVVEATLRSGSLLTARHALDQGREVFAVPGPVGAPRSRGPHELLKRGAKLVETVDDVIDELPILQAARSDGSAAARNSLLGERGAEILLRLDPGPRTIDELAGELDRQVAEIWEDLLTLELLGRVRREPGGRYAVSEAGHPR